jgi:AraC-like DNA-binding protein
MPDLIRSAVLKGLPELVTRLGGNPMRLLADHGFGIPELEDPDRLISFSKFAQLLNAAACDTQSQQFGLTLSRCQGVATLGMLGMAMQQSPDLGAAMETFRRYFYLHAQAASIEISVVGDVFVGKYLIDLPSVDNLTQLVDLSLGHGMNIFRFLCGPELVPRGVYFIHDKPADTRPYKELFKVPIHFNADFNGLTYDASILKIPIRQHDDELHRVLSRHLHELERRHPNDIVSQVDHMIRQVLPTGSCSITLIADCLNMGKRTLQNHLHAQGATFQQILDVVRSDIASNYLQESNVSMTYLADILGYSELSAFSRAFKRWFGVAPRNWKTIPGKGESLTGSGAMDRTRG